jgi:hypothetical protein
VREVTWFAALGALLIAILVSFSYPYIVLKLGEGPNVSLLSAFLGAAFLFLVARRTHGQNRLMNNVIQTAGTSASMTAFMCVIAAGFDYLARDQRVAVSISITPIQMFIWLTLAGSIGVLFVPVFRKYFLDDPRLTFPDGVSAAETVKTLDSDPRETRGKLATLGGSGLVGGGFGFLNDGLNAIPPWYWNRGLLIGTDWNLLSLGRALGAGRQPLRLGVRADHHSDHRAPDRPAQHRARVRPALPRARRRRRVDERATNAADHPLRHAAGLSQRELFWAADPVDDVASDRDADRLGLYRGRPPVARDCPALSYPRPNANERRGHSARGHARRRRHPRRPPRGVPEHQLRPVVS